MQSLPAQLDPQLCLAAKAAPAGGAWIHELKYDGWRFLARKDGAVVRLYTRGRHDWTEKLPTIAQHVRALPCDRAWLDGELVHLRADGFPDFEALQNDVRRGAEGRLFYQVWDMPWLDGRSLVRDALLEQLSL